MPCKQITIFIDSLLSKYQCRFRKGFSAQHCLLALLEKWKNAVDKGKPYNTKTKQPPKVNHTYCSWEEILFGVSQGSTFEPILFNIFLRDLFLVISDTDFSSYADDNTLYDFGNSIYEVFPSLQESSEKVFQWFSHNQMKRNTDKCHLIVSIEETIEIRVGESLIKNSTCEKLLGAKLITNLILILVPKVFVRRQIVN